MQGQVGRQQSPQAMGEAGWALCSPAPPAGGGAECPPFKASDYWLSRIMGRGWGWERKIVFYKEAGA